MLSIFNDVRQFQRDAAAICSSLRRYDTDLARQLKRSAQSVALNLSEGMAATAGDRRRSYGIALREAQECRGAIAIAADWGYAVVADDVVLDRLDKIIATLWKLTRPTRVA